MHNVSAFAVFNMWFVSGLTFFVYMAVCVYLYVRCINQQVVQAMSTIKAHAFPHVNYLINRLFHGLTHITHRTYKNNDYLYNYIIINSAEVL